MAAKPKYIYLISNGGSGQHKTATVFFSPQGAERYMRNGYYNSKKVTRLQVINEEEVVFETQVIVRPPKPKAPRKKAAPSTTQR